MNQQVFIERPRFFMAGITKKKPHWSIRIYCYSDIPTLGEKGGNQADTLGIQEEIENGSQEDREALINSQMTVYMKQDPGKISC